MQLWVVPAGQMKPKEVSLAGAAARSRPARCQASSLGVWRVELAPMMINSVVLAVFVSSACRGYTVAYSTYCTMTSTQYNTRTLTRAIQYNTIQDKYVSGVEIEAFGNRKMQGG